MRMKIIFTNHAQQRKIERSVSDEQIKQTIELPDYTIKKENKIEAHKRINDKTLKVVYAEKGNFIKIITLIWK